MRRIGNCREPARADPCPTGVRRPRQRSSS